MLLICLELAVSVGLGTAPSPAWVPVPPHTFQWCHYLASGVENFRSKLSTRGLRVYTIEEKHE